MGTIFRLQYLLYVTIDPNIIPHVKWNNFPYVSVKSIIIIITNPLMSTPKNPPLFPVLLFRNGP